MNHWKDVPDVEPLPDTTWRRIERSVFQELDRDAERAPARPPTPWTIRWRRPLVGLGLGLGLATAAALLLMLRPPPDVGPQPSRIATVEAPVELTVGRASIRVAPQSTVLVHSNHGHEVLIHLEQGRVECAVAHAENQPPLVLQAGDVRVEVVGTRFAVTRQGHSASVEVQEGVVEVFHRGKLTRVGTGQHWSPPELSATTAIPAQHDPTAHDTPAAEIDADPTAHGTPAAEIDADPTAHGTPAAEIDADPNEAAATPDDTSPDTQRRSPDTAGTGNGTQRTGQPRTTAAARADQTANPKQRYEQAARLEASEPAAAIAIYRELARGKDAWAANALFAQARLELDRGRTPEAVRLLETYLRRFPDGNNAADARALLETVTPSRR